MKSIYKQSGRVLVALLFCLVGGAIYGCGAGDVGKTAVHNQVGEYAIEGEPIMAEQGELARRTGFLPQAAIANQPKGSDILNVNTRAGDALSGMLLSRMSSGAGVLVANMVDMDDLDKSTTLGRLSMQQIGSRLSQHGFKVLEPRLAKELRMEKHDGEFMLTRESLELLSATHDAHAVLTGVYTRNGGRLFMSVRVVRLADSAVLAAYEYYLPRGDDKFRAAYAGGAGDNGDIDPWDDFAGREKAFPPPSR